MTNPNNENQNDKSQAQAGKDQHQAKTGQQAGQQQGQHGQQAKPAETKPGADTHQRQDNKSAVKKDDSQNNKR